MKINIISTNKCQLRCKFCLNAKLDGPKRDEMDFWRFREIVNKCTEFGFNEFDLTPNIGDVFLDKNFIHKIRFLESHNKVKKYEFVTNFLGCSNDNIEELVSCFCKMNCDISVYGWDRLSYYNNTNRDQYDNFKKKLSYLEEVCRDYETATAFMLYMRCCEINKFPKKDKELSKILKSLLSLDIRVENAEVTNRNWGGKIKTNNCSKKKGICSRILNENGIYPNGDITLCNCWDWNKELIIGNIDEGLEHLYNEDGRFKEIIDNQYKGIYEGPCKECDDFSILQEDDLQINWTKKYKIIL